MQKQNSLLVFRFSALVSVLSVNIKGLEPISAKTWTISQMVKDGLEIGIMTCRWEGWMNNGLCLNGKIQLLMLTRKLILSPKTLTHNWTQNHRWNSHLTRSIIWKLLTSSCTLAEYFKNLICSELIILLTSWFASDLPIDTRMTRYWSGDNQQIRDKWAVETPGGSFWK